MTDIDRTRRGTGRPRTPDRRNGSERNFHKLFGASVISNLGDGVAHDRLPVAGVGRHPQPGARRARDGRATSALARVHAARRRHHRPGRPAQGDGARWTRCAGCSRSASPFAVLGRAGRAARRPTRSTSVTGTRTGLYLLVLLATLLLGMAEVLRDNSAQTLMPSLVHPDHLEKANGRLWSAEGVANTFVGPPLGSLLLVAAFAVPFFVDAASFFVAAALVALIPGTFRAERDASVPRRVVQGRARRGRALADGSPAAAADGDHPRADERSPAWSAARRSCCSRRRCSTSARCCSASSGSAPRSAASSAARSRSWASKRFGSGTCLAVVLGGSRVAVGR